MVNVRLLTNIGRLWTGSEVWSNKKSLNKGAVGFAERQHDPRTSDEHR